MDDALLQDLLDWLRIPSISTGDGDPADLERAALWVTERVKGAGGTADLVTIDGGNPLAVGELRAADPGAPTVLIYGHYDVQSPGDISAWQSPPFDPDIRDGRLYARGAADDKGNFLPLLHVACAMARDGALPVNVRVLVEGEEEVGGESVAHWLHADERRADAAIVFDGGMEDENTPAITVGLRGIAQAHVTVRTGVRDLHQGLYGGSVLNALHVLHRMVATVLPGPDGRVREELRAGIVEPSATERESWARLTPGDQVLSNVGAQPLDPRAGAEFYERTGAQPALDVNEVTGGQPRTVIPSVATATLTLRLAPRQDSRDMCRVLAGLLREAAPDGAEVEITFNRGEPALFEPSEPALKLAADAIARACGTDPVFVRTGGSIPVVAEMAAVGMPTIVSGFTLPDDAFHAPNESYALRSLELGEASSRELLSALAAIPRR